MYDAIVVGARVAGSPTAMLLARKGYRVLLVDRATFPSDMISTHCIQIPGILLLQRWGLLDRVVATDPGSARRVHFDFGKVIEGEFPSVEGVDAICSPRRLILDKILVDAAVEAGAELREGFITQDLLWEDGRVMGIRGRLKSGETVTERARIVIGADGRHSFVAKAVDAPRYDEVPALTCIYYSYWEGVPMEGSVAIYERRPQRAIVMFPTNDKLTLIAVVAPVAEFNTIRADVEGSFLAALDLVPSLAERVRAGRRVERIFGTADLDNFYRKPCGAGWALVGDAGYSQDPISPMGISDAFRDAQLLADALDAGFSGREPLDLALSGYQQKRDAASKPNYQSTIDNARMTPPTPEATALFEALRHNPAAASQFFGVITGGVSPSEFFAPANLSSIIGASGAA